MTTELYINLKVSGVPTKSYAPAGEMSDGAIITENNKTYSAPFIRTTDECALINNANEFIAIDTVNNTTHLTLVKGFITSSDAENYMKTFDTNQKILIQDSVMGAEYEANIVEVIDYDIYD